MTTLIECHEFHVSASNYKRIQNSRFNKLPIYAYCITHIDTFKLDIYVSQLYFNVTNKVARYTVAIVQKFHNGKSNKFNE